MEHEEAWMDQGAPLSACQAEIAAAVQAESGRVLATLISQLGDWDLAEDCLQDACVAALEHWPQAGLPRNPAAWLVTTARRKALDRLRRRQTLERKLPLLHMHSATEDTPMDADTFPDERLKLLFTCCHPALELETQIALTLHTVAGLSTADVAHAFMLRPATMAQRLTRAKRKIRAAAIPYRVPPLELLPTRLPALLMVIYLIFSTGYAAPSGEQLLRVDLCEEAIRLARILTRLFAAQLQPNAEALGLLALLLLHHSRRAARTGVHGELITLEEQDRSRWSRALIDEGLTTLDAALALHDPGPYQIQAAISALHVQAASAAATDWPQIALLYDALWRWQPTPIVALNRAVAIAMAHGYAHGLALLDDPELAAALHDYQHYHAARAELLQRLERYAEAAAAYTQALARCQNTSEHLYLSRRLAEVSRS